MRKLYALATLALVPLMGACADNDPTVFDAAAQFSNGVAAPGSVLQVSFTVPGTSTSGYWLGAGVDPTTAPNNSCVEVGGVAGYFKNPAGNVGSNQNPGQCWVQPTGSAPQLVTFNLSANHVQAKSGNEQLNFGSVCNPEDPEACSETWVHYKANSNWSTGKGVVYGGGYYVLLGSVDMTGNVIAGRPIAVSACLIGGTLAQCYGGTLTW
jgi:hypothetical protein